MLSNLREVKKADAIFVTVLEGDGTKGNIYREVRRIYADGVLYDIKPFEETADDEFTAVVNELVEEE